MDNRERALTVEQVHKAVKDTQQPWSKMSPSYYAVTDVPALTAKLNEALGEARAPIEGEPQPLLHASTKHAPPCHCPDNFCQAPRIMGRQMPCSRGRCETYTELCKCGSTAKIRFDCVLPKGHTADHAFRDAGRAERVLEAAPGKLDRCPKCGGDITSEGGHGLWCRDEKCKWGWEIEPAAVPLPTAREPVNMLWSGTNSQGGSTGRVYNDPLMQKAYDEGRKHGAPVSEGRLREASALPIQWRNIADAKPSSFEFATSDDAFRYCAAELERALESA